MPKKPSKPITPNAANKELGNFEEIMQLVKPKETSVPELEGIEVYGQSIPLYTIGGDHITYLDFKKRFDLEARLRQAYELGQQDVARHLESNRTKAGIYLMDVNGHQDTDALPAAMLHQVFLACADYELEMNGRITTNLFEKVNMRFYRSTGIDKMIAGLYGEVATGGNFRFLAQGNPFPVVFSSEYDRFVELADVCGREFVPSESIGLLPSGNHIDKRIYRQHVRNFQYKSPYTVNEILIQGVGDILVMFSDGLSDHSRPLGPDDCVIPDTPDLPENIPRELYMNLFLEDTLRKYKYAPAKEICAGIAQSVMDFNPVRGDDISYVVIKKTK